MTHFKMLLRGLSILLLTVKAPECHSDECHSADCRLAALTHRARLMCSVKLGTLTWNPY
jgi:hypothetical protein